MAHPRKTPLPGSALRLTQQTASKYNVPTTPTPTRIPAPIKRSKHSTITTTCTPRRTSSSSSPSSTTSSTASTPFYTPRNPLPPRRPANEPKPDFNFPDRLLSALETHEDALRPLLEDLDEERRRLRELIKADFGDGPDGAEAEAVGLGGRAIGREGILGTPAGGIEGQFEGHEPRQEGERKDEEEDATGACRQTANHGSGILSSETEDAWEAYEDTWFRLKRVAGEAAGEVRDLGIEMMTGWEGDAVKGKKETGREGFEEGMEDEQRAELVEKRDRRREKWRRREGMSESELVREF